MWIWAFWYDVLNGDWNSIVGGLKTVSFERVSRWFTSVNHKDIGILYILFGVMCGSMGGMLS